MHTGLAPHGGQWGETSSTLYKILPHSILFSRRKCCCLAHPGADQAVGSGQDGLRSCPDRGWTSQGGTDSARRVEWLRAGPDRSWNGTLMRMLRGEGALVGPLSGIILALQGDSWARCNGISRGGRITALASRSADKAVRQGHRMAGWPRRASLLHSLTHSFFTTSFFLTTQLAAGAVPETNPQDNHRGRSYHGCS